MKKLLFLEEAKIEFFASVDYYEQISKVLEKQVEIKIK